MASYTDVYIGFITNENLVQIKKRKNGPTDHLQVRQLHSFFQDHCLVQYCNNNSFDYHLSSDPIPCWFCGQIFSSKKLIYYQGQMRLIFPEYMYHNIRFHNIEIDEKLLEIIGDL